MVPPAVDPVHTGATAAGVRALEIRRMSKAFSGHRALQDVSLTVAAGEVHALLGQNGSGKSTLIKVLSGFYDADFGAEFVFDGVAVDVETSARRSNWRRHLRFVHQDLALVESLDVVENLALERGFATGRLGRVDWRAERERARQVLARLGFDVDVLLPVGQLSRAERTIVAIARALQDWDDDQFGVLVLDEPTTSLSRVEAERLYAAVVRVARRGAGVLLVTHQLQEVLEVADRYTILRDGSVVAEGEVATVDELELVELITGSAIERCDAPKSEPTRDAVLAVDSLTSAGFGPVSFSVRGGEILGVAGLEGSGRELLASLVAGAEGVRGGSVRVGGTEVVMGDVRAAMRSGVALLPADRMAKGMVGQLSVKENLLLARYSDVCRGVAGLFRIVAAKERAQVVDWIGRLELRPSNAERLAGTLSGGNQQKVVLARALRLAPRVLVLDEPTQGVDVGARAKIYEQVAAAARSGTAVLLCSSDDAELANECDRVLVMREGRVAVELRGPQLTAHGITSVSLQALPTAEPEVGTA